MKTRVLMEQNLVKADTQNEFIPEKDQGLEEAATLRSTAACMFFFPS